MKPLSHASLALALLAGGILLGRAIPGGVKNGLATGRLVEHSTPSRHLRPGALANAGKTPPADEHNLVSLLARQKTDANAAGDLRSELERMDAARLKAIALEQLSAAVAAPEGEDRAHGTLFDAAIAELWRREGTAALEWSAALPGKEERGTATKRLLENALRDNPSTALPWMEKYHEEHGKSATNNDFLSLAMKGAVDRGADEAIRTFGLFSGTNLINPLYNVRFPEGFDFAKLHSALADKIDLREAISEWALRDPESAWSAVQDRLSKKEPGSHYSNPLTLIMKAVAAREGEAEGVNWIMERIATLPPEQRQEQMKKLDQRGELSPEGVGAIAAALPPEERTVYTSNVVREAGASARAYAALDTLPREELVTALQVNLRGSNSHIGPLPGTAASAAYTDRILHEVQDRYQLTPQEMEVIQAAQVR